MIGEVNLNRTNDRHEESIVASFKGAHSIRYFSKKLQFYVNGAWHDISLNQSLYNNVFHTTQGFAFSIVAPTQLSSAQEIADYVGTAGCSVRWGTPKSSTIMPNAIEMPYRVYVDATESELKLVTLTAEGADTALRIEYSINSCTHISSELW